MNMVNRVLNKPAGNRQFSDQEVAAAAQQMEPYLAAPPEDRPQLPPPINKTSGFITGQVAPPRPGQPVPVQERQFVPQQAVRPRPGGVYQTIEPEEAVPQAPVLQQPVEPPQVEILSPDAAVPPMLEEAEVEPAETPEDRLRYHVNAMLEECLADIQDQRHVHQWPFSAFEVLKKPFLDALARTRNDTERVTLVKSYADAQLFQQFYQIFWRPGGSEHFRQFSAGLQQLINLHMESQAHGNTAAVS